MRFNYNLWSLMYQDSHKTWLMMRSKRWRRRPCRRWWSCRGRSWRWSVQCPTQDWVQSLAPNCSGASQTYSGQDRVRLLRWDGDTVITLLWWREWSLMRLKSGTFCADKYNKTNTFNLNDAFWQQSPVLTTPVSASEPCNNCKNCPIHPCGLRRNGYKASTLAIK